VIVFLAGLLVGAFCAIVMLALVVAGDERRQVRRAVDRIIRQYAQQDVTRNRPNERGSTWVIARNGGITGVRTRSGVALHLGRDR
jgi:hypothetical protein